MSERVTGMPGWASLPSVVGTSSLLVALLGMYWDIALHINVGRDEGPLANPAHYLILVGLFGIFAAGCIAVGLPKGEKPTPSAVRITEGWYAPVGAILIALAGGYALLGFPLDDMWHRLFGQDVTLWGPTHLMLIGGAGMTLIGQAILLREGRPDEGRRGRGPDALRARTRRRSAASSAMGGLLIGLSTFQAEFDFGVPQFHMVFHPVLIAIAAGVALVASRDLDRPRRRDRRGRLLPRRARRRQPDRRPRLRRDHSRAAALRRRRRSASSWPPCSSRASGRLRWAPPPVR